MNLTTHRLRIRNLRESDLDAFHAYRSDPAVTRYQGFEPMSRQEARDFLHEMATAAYGKPGDWVQFGIADRETNQLLGDCALKPDAQDPRMAEIGLTLAPSAQGRGLATEALRALIGWLFAETEVVRGVLITGTENTACVRLLERCGLRREGHFVENVWFKGRWASEFLYAVLKREWGGV